MKHLDLALVAASTPPWTGVQRLASGGDVMDWITAKAGHDGRLEVDWPDEGQALAEPAHYD